MEILQIIIAGVFSLTVGLGSVWLKHVLDTKKKTYDDINHETITSSDIDTIVEIQKYLDCFKKRWDLDRLGIFQFHNGGKFFFGVSMKKYSQSFESLGNGIIGVKSTNQSILVTDHPPLMQALNENEFFVIDPDIKNQEFTDKWMEEQGILQSIVSPIRTLSGQLMGFLSIEMIKHKREITRDFKDDVLDLVSVISGYLVRK